MTRAETRLARAVYLGRRPYGEMLALQEALHDARRHQRIADTILLVEHDPVVTLGRSAKETNLLLSRDALRRRGIDVFDTGRGGDVTYHGPGQLVGYPILDLKPNRCDLRWYVRALAEVMILVARDHHVEAGVVDGLVGVWVDSAQPDQWATAPWATRLAKIGAIGVRVSRWVTMHGFALNLDVALEDFDVIVPCGIREHPVSRLSDLSREPVSLKRVALDLSRHLSRALDQPVSSVENLEEAGDLGEALLRPTEASESAHG
jgi:lipoyl(octanoyl) transferase